MTRYFLDTGPMLGVTFLHDLWRDESERLFDTDNTLYTCDAAIYEYCNYDGSTIWTPLILIWSPKRDASAKSSRKFASHNGASTSSSRVTKTTS